MEVKNMLGQWTRRALEIELTIENAPFFKGENYPFKSPHYQMAFNYAQIARMFSGDLLRLVVLKDKYRDSARFMTAQFYDKVPQSAHLIGFTEVESIRFLKDFIRTLFYEVIDTEFINYEISSNSFVNEFKVYKAAFEINLKQADQQLGLRLGGLQI